MNASVIFPSLSRLLHTANKRRDIGAFTSYALRRIWLIPLFAILIFYSSGLFIDSVQVRVVICVALCVFPWLAVVRKLFAGSREHMRTQLLVVLQALCTSVSSGYSIEKSLVLVRPVIENTFGRRSPLIRPLIALENDLKMHVGLESALVSFAESINFPETLPVFHALAISGQIGNNTLAILRSACQMLSELNAVKSEIQASNAGKNAEAAMLCVMPFAITFALNNMSSEYMALARTTRTGSTLLAVSFGICIIAVSLLLRFMAHDTGRKIKSKVNIGFDDSIKVGSSRPLSRIILKILPPGIVASRHELFSELSVNPSLAYEQYLKKQVLLCSVSALLGAAILTAAGRNPAFAVIFVIAVCLLSGREVRNEAQLKREDLMQDIPLFMCLISTLLEAGMQLPKAIEICAKAFGDNKNLSLEIKNIRAMMLSGISASDAVEAFSLRVQIPEAQAALLLVARYGRLGTSEVLNLLQLQSQSCWDLCRNAARKKQEREALALLFPMTLDFICVLMVATTPAIISLGI